MKIRSLLLGSVAAAGLSTGAFAADLGVLTSLDVCDALGLSGLTISSDTNCLQITGGVAYEFRWGDFRSSVNIVSTPFGIVDNWAGNHSSDEAHYDWYSKVEAWVKFVGTADSDFGPAKAVIKMKEVQAFRATDAEYSPWDDDSSEGFSFDEAYVSIGDSTVIMAGRKGSIANFGDSTPFNFGGLFGTGKVDTGTLFDSDDDPSGFGGHVIQVVSDLGNGVSVAVGLENLDGSKGADAEHAGTAVGVLSYKGDGLTAHITAAAGGILDGIVEDWAFHAGATASFDNFKVRGAFGYLAWDHSGSTGNDLHAMLTAEATFDIFTLALSGEYLRSDDNGTVDDGFGVGGSIGAAVSDGITINLGARYFNYNADPAFNRSATEVKAELAAQITETLKVVGGVGAYFTAGDAGPFVDHLYYGSLELAWEPGGGFTSSVKGEVNSEGGYRTTFKAAKTFD